jgi:hypothetical protein
VEHTAGAAGAEMVEPRRDAMKVTETRERMVVADTPGCLWLFGGMFVLSGSFVLLMLLMDAGMGSWVAWERLSALVIGASHFAVGFWLVRRHVETRTELDRGSGQGSHRVRRPWSRQVVETTFALADVRSVDIRHDRDGDGDPVFQLRLWLSGSRMLPLQGQPAQGERKALEHADAIRRFLKLEASV